jgi:hypothetical protein
MKKHIQPLTALFAAVFAILACSSSFEVVGTQSPASEQSNTPIVASAEPDDLLPHTFYYLGIDNSTSLAQIFRMERDGKTATQLTFEPVNVTEYDVSLVDGSIAYVAGNQLIAVNADGFNRRVLVEGDPDNPAGGIQSPVFSPDGQTIAYGYMGLNLYDSSTGISSLVIENQYGDPLPNGALFPLEIYWPDQYSPDGTKLLVSLGHWEQVASTAIYDLNKKVLIRYAEVERYAYCCNFYGGAEWSPDSSSFFAVASAHDYSFASGELWKVDANTGAVTMLIPSGAGEGATLIIYLSYKPYLAPDGQLYFFSAKYPESAGYSRRAPLILTRSKPDDITTNWTVLRPDTFELMNEALWAPDANFVVVAYAPSEDVYNGGKAEIVYLDGRPSVALTSFAQQMKWGP